MEHGFYHPSRGYWQTNTDVSPHILAGYPEGTVEVPLKPGADYDWNGTEWVQVLPDPDEIRAATHAAINAERAHRLAADFTFQGKQYQRDSVSVQRITGAATLAGFAMAQGAQPGNHHWHGGEQPFAWIASDNSLTLMDAQTTFAFGNACATVETRLIFAAKALRDADPIPEDFADDKYWP